MKIAFDDEDRVEVKLYVKDVAALRAVLKIVHRLNRHLPYAYLEQTEGGLERILTDYGPPGDVDPSPDV